MTSDKINLKSLIYVVVITWQILVYFSSLKWLMAMGVCCIYRWVRHRNRYRKPSLLTHSDRVTHICASKLIIIGSKNGLSPDRCQAIIWSSAGISLFWPNGNFSEILIEIYRFLLNKVLFYFVNVARKLAVIMHFVSVTLCECWILGLTCYLWLSKLLANSKIPNICNIFFHWLTYRILKDRLKTRWWCDGMINITWYSMRE